MLSLLIKEDRPTRAFVSAFCDQVGDLVIRIPIRHDIRIPIRHDMDKNGSRLDLGDIFVGTRVSRGKAKGVIIKGSPTTSTSTYSVELKKSKITIPGLLREALHSKKIQSHCLTVVGRVALFLKEMCTLIVDLII